MFSVSPYFFYSSVRNSVFIYDPLRPSTSLQTLGRVLYHHNRHTESEPVPAKVDGPKSLGVQGYWQKYCWSELSYSIIQYVKHTFICICSQRAKARQLFSKICFIRPEKAKPAKGKTERQGNSGIRIYCTENPAEQQTHQ